MWKSMIAIVGVVGLAWVIAIALLRPEPVKAGGPNCTEMDGDMDGDGHKSTDCRGDDCDDNNRNRYPGNVEACEGTAAAQQDQDCDPTTFGFKDADGDGDIAAICCNTHPSTGAKACGSDCDDTSPGLRGGSIRCSPVAGRLNAAAMEICRNGTWASITCSTNGYCMTQPNGAGVCYEPRPPTQTLPR